MDENATAPRQIIQVKKGGQNVLNNIVPSMLPIVGYSFSLVYVLVKHLNHCYVKRNVVDNTGASVVVDVHV